MSAGSYETALRIAELLSRDEQLRLIEELAAYARAGRQAAKTSILDLCGLGQGIWGDMDAQEYVDGERASWNG